MKFLSLFFLILLAGNVMAAPMSKKTLPGKHWQVWLKLGGVLLDTPEKAADFAEAVIRARYGQAEVDEERPFVVDDLGDAWRVKGTNLGSHAMPLVPVYSVVTLRKDNGEIIDYMHKMPYPIDEAARRGFIKAGPQK